MKRLLIIVICLAALSIYGCNKATEAEARGDPCKSFLGGVLNDCVQHPKEKDTWIYGVGVDIPLWKAEKLLVDQETRLELNNGVNSDGIATYTVFKPQLEEGILQTAWGFLVKLNPFNR
jgi:hypothetical protein